MKQLRIVSLVFCVCVLAGGLSESTVQAEEFYAGKTITCIVPYPPGGGTDTFFRTMVPYWQKHIPGKPEMIIKNMAGAGGMTANNFVYEKAKPDGLTVLTAPWLSMAQITKQPGARVKYDEMVLIGGQTEGKVIYISNKVVPNGVADLKNVKMIKMGGLRASSNMDIRNLLSLEMLGIQIKHITGYRGGAKAVAALMRGDLDMFASNYSSWKATWEKSVQGEGLGKAVWYQSAFDKSGNQISFDAIEKDGIPRYEVVYEMLKGKKPAGEKWEAYKWFMNVSMLFALSAWLPPNSPDAAAQALRTGWYKLSDDEEFQAASVKRFGARTILPPYELCQGVVNNYVGNPDPKMVKYFKDFIAKYSK